MVIFKKIYIKNGIFLKNFMSKFDPNIHQKCTKLHHFKKFSRRGMPPSPPSKARSDMQISKSQKKILGPPSQILATPLYTISGPRLYALLIV